MKKVLSMLLALVMVLALMPVGVISVSAAESDFTFSIYDGKVTVTDYTGSGGGVVIPSTFRGLPVTIIRDYAFDNCTSLTSVTIPDSVTSIGDYAFSGCNSLTEFVVTPDNAAYSSVDGVLFDKNKTTLIQYPIGNTATSYTIPDSVTSIGGDAFAYCYSLTSVTIPDSVTSIGEDAFYSCDSLTSVTIGNSVTSIGDRAFAICNNLTSVTIGNSVTSIGDNAFEYCYSLSSVTIGSGVTSIGDSAFRGCDSLTEFVVAPDNIVYCSVDGVLFDKNKTTLIQYPIGNATTSYTIKAGTKTIANYAFSDCDSLTAVTIPDSVTSIGGYAFSDCDSLKEFIVAPDNTAYCSVDGVLFDKNKTTLIQYPIGNAATSYTIPDSVTSIGNSAFFDCDSLTSVTIPNSVTSIGERAFAWCTNLTSVTIPDSVTSIGDDAFYYCDSLASVTIPDSVTSIGDWAFCNCSNLTSVTIGSGVTSIGKGAFSYTAIYNNNANWENGVLYINNHLIDAETSLSGAYTIKAGTKTIANYAFSDCGSLTSVTIGNGVTSIGRSAFSHCGSLTSVTIPDSVTSIGDNAFAWCTSLTAVTIPDSVTSIGDYAFHYCFSLSSVIIPDSVTSIGDSAFAFCNNLTSVTIGNSVTSIGAGAFDSCYSLTEFIVAPHNTAYCSVDGVLFDKNKTTLIQYPIGKTATSYTIPDSVTRIWDCAFAYCTSLTSVTIPDSVTSISDWAFDDCDSLIDVYYQGTIADRANITIGICNDSLINATWHYNVVIETPCNYQWVIDQKETCGKAGVKHEECTDCHAKRNENTSIPATGKHTFSPATCTKAATCKVCGVPSGKALGHKYTNACDTSCDVCKATRKITHSYAPATCTKAATCKVCGVTNGNKLGHKYTNNCDSTCNTCGATRKITHAYKTTTTKATLKKNGSVVKKCTVCGDEASKTIIKKIKTVNLSDTSYTYNGKAKKPSVIVKDSAGKTISSKNYTVSYSSKSPKNVGTYKVTVKFKGNYSGSKTLPFKINPPKTTVKKLTAAKKGLKVAITKKTTQVTGYEVQYSTSKKFTKAATKTKTVKSAKTTSLTLKSLKAKKTYYVRVRTYKTVSGKKYYSAWSTYKTKKTK